MKALGKSYKSMNLCLYHFLKLLCFHKLCSQMVNFCSVLISTLSGKSLIIRRYGLIRLISVIASVHRVSKIELHLSMTSSPTSVLIAFKIVDYCLLQFLWIFFAWAAYASCAFFRLSLMKKMMNELVMSKINFYKK